MGHSHLAFVSPVPALASYHSGRTTTCRLRSSSFTAPSLVPLLLPQAATDRHAYRPRKVVLAVAAPETSSPCILISGAPASGKGTQCELLVEHYGVVHISTGDMLRAAVKDGTSLGLQAKAFMDAGDLVPDDLVISMLKERITQEDCQQRGWLLDGFPRTAVQAQALDDAGILPTAVLQLDVEDDVLIERVVGRRLDPVTGKIYHVKFSPPTEDQVAERLIQRSDDTEEKALVRLKNYYTHAQSIQDHYSALVNRVNGNRSKNDVFSDLVAIVDNSSKTDDDNQSNGPSTGGAASTSAASAAVADSTASQSDTTAKVSAKGLSVPEFVRRAEEAFERGELYREDVNWSGQAGADTVDTSGSSSYNDLAQRLDLVFGDASVFLLFAYIGRAYHGNTTFDLEVIKTAAPFLAAWFLTSPLLGLYTRAATANLMASFMSFSRGWAVAVPMGIGLRGVVTQHVPPALFAGISLAFTFVLLGSWRLTYVKVRGDETSNTMRGGVFDGFRMITTLLRRW